MRDPQLIELEIDVARQDLETTLSQLKEVVLDKLDVKKHAKKAMGQAVTRGKQKARDLANRGKQRMIDLARRGKQQLRGTLHRIRIDARERPELALLAAAGLLVVSAWFVRRRMRG